MQIRNVSAGSGPTGLRTRKTSRTVPGALDFAIVSILPEERGGLICILRQTNPPLSPRALQTRAGAPAGMPTDLDDAVRCLCDANGG